MCKSSILEHSGKHPPPSSVTPLKIASLVSGSAGNRSQAAFCLQAPLSSHNGTRLAAPPTYLVTAQAESRCLSPIKEHTWPHATKRSKSDQALESKRLATCGDSRATMNAQRQAAPTSVRLVPEHHRPLPCLPPGAMLPPNAPSLVFYLKAQLKFYLFNSFNKHLHRP